MRPQKLKRALLRPTIFLAKISLLLGLVWGAYQAYQTLFTITTVSCEIEQDQCSPAVIAEINRLKGQKLNQVNLDQISQKILGSSPEYLKASFSKNLPGEVNLSLEKSRDIAQVSISSQSGVFTLSNTYKVTNYYPQPTEKLDKITLQKDPNIHVGDIIKQTRLGKTLQLIQGLEDNYIPFQSTFLATDSAQIQLKSGPTAYFDPNKDHQVQIKVLQVILASDLENPINTIDLRFEKPILTFTD